MLISQFTMLFWAHICLRETTTSCSLYISAVQVSNSSLLLFCKGTCIWFVSRWSFLSTVLIKLWYVWICTREKLTRLTEHICLAVSCSSWEMTQYSLKAEMLELESQYGGKNISFCNQLEQSGCSRISKNLSGWLLQLLLIDELQHYCLAASEQYPVCKKPM